MANFDGEIKIQSWIKKIKVNEQGDFVEINIGDATLLNRYTNLLQNMQEVIYQYESSKDHLEDNVVNSMTEYSNLNNKVSSLLKSFFGEDICDKVFGTEIPFLGDVIEFLYKIGEYIENFTGEKIKHMDSIKDTYVNRAKRRAKL